VREKVSLLHIVLFVLTLLSTLAAGALQRGADFISEPSRLAEGIPFSFTLMAILLSHELSHYFASQYHRTRATLPYFIPAPTFFGTFGAFIKMKSPIMSRKALIDIGASGPIVGFLFSVVACAVGLSLSEFVVPAAYESEVLTLGNSALFAVLSDVFMGTPPEGHDILLHPIAFAGWIGLFITFLNLLPIGQLDGGHVAFALLGQRHSTLSMVLVVVLAVVGINLWFGWAIWAALMVALGLRHPPIMNWEVPLDPRRRFVGWLSLFIFAITFIPQPFPGVQ
jgi:membrane-associated protease RseP (regulator of RpoE activity)